MNFRERDGVCIEYEVRGFGTDDVPYVNELATLREAIAIGRRYPGVYHDGAATRIYRRFSKRAPAGANYHHSSRYTHCFSVFADGRIEIVTRYEK